MSIKNKQLRYYYWLIIEFFKKNFLLILLSTIASVMIVIAGISLSPFISGIIETKKVTIGLLGNYTADAMPDEILSKVSNGLLFVNDRGEFVPALASSWEITDGGRQYRVQLKKNLFWSDNKPVNAREINYKFKDVEVFVHDDYLIEYRLKRPLAVFPNYLSQPIIRYPAVGIAGLYRVNKLKTKNEYVTEISLLPNKSGIPALTYKFYDTENKLVTAYKLGEISEFSITKKTVADTFKSWKNTNIVQSVDYSRLLTMFINQKSKLFEDKEIRQALSMAINRRVFDKEGVEAIGPIPPNSWAYNPDLKKNLYDKSAAEQIIGKSTVASQSAKLNFNTYYEYLENAEQIKKWIAESGFDVNLNIGYGAAQDNFDLLLAFWKVPFDPDQYFFWHSTQTQNNITGYKNLKVDKLLEDGRSITAITDRKKIYYEFQRVIVDDTPAIFLYYPYVYTVKRK